MYSSTSPLRFRGTLLVRYHTPTFHRATSPEVHRDRPPVVPAPTPVLTTMDGDTGSEGTRVLSVNPETQREEGRHHWSGSSAQLPPVPRTSLQCSVPRRGISRVSVPEGTVDGRRPVASRVRPVPGSPGFRHSTLRVSFGTVHRSVSWCSPCLPPVRRYVPPVPPRHTGPGPLPCPGPRLFVNPDVTLLVRCFSPNPHWDPGSSNVTVSPLYPSTSPMSSSSSGPDLPSPRLFGGPRSEETRLGTFTSNDQTQPGTPGEGPDGEVYPCASLRVVFEVRDVFVFLYTVGGGRGWEGPPPRVVFRVGGGGWVVEGLRRVPSESPSVLPNYTLHRVLRTPPLTPFAGPVPHPRRSPVRVPTVRQEP